MRTLPLYALNFVLATATELWALRYPATHELWLLDRPAGGTDTTRELDARSDRIHAKAELADAPAVVIATERMDDDPAWRPLGGGELVRITPDLRIECSTPFAAPRHPLSLADLNPTAAASQHPAVS